MLSNNPRPDKFSLRLPTNFFIKEICEKYNRYIELNNSYFTNIEQMVNESIIGVSIPGLTQEVRAQTTTAASTSTGTGVEQDVTYYLDTKPLEEIVESTTITITFRHLDSYINYFFLMETFYKMYNRSTDSTNTRFNIPIICLSSDDHPVFIANLGNSIFQSISSIDLLYNNQSRDFKEFTCQFVYSDFIVDFDLPQGTAKSYK